MWTTFGRATARAVQLGAVSRAARVASRAPANRHIAFIAASPWKLAVRRGFATAQTTPAAKKKKPAAKKKVTGRKTTTRSASTSAKPRKAAKAKPKKKPAAKGRPKKQLTPEEKQKAEIRELKAVALLKEPARLPETSWTVYTTGEIKGVKGQGSLGEVVKEISTAYRALSQAELDRLASTARQNHLTNVAAHKAWVESHTPAEIAEANRARNRLRRTFKATSKGVIQDERLPKRAASGYLLFTKARWESGDFSGQATTEVGKALGQEWKNMSESERKPYNDASEQERARYEREVKSVLGRDVAKSK